MKYLFLIIYTITEVIRDVFFVGGAVYLSIWRHCSGWWVVLGIVLCMSPTYFKIIRKEFNV